MIDFAISAEREEKKSPKDSIFEACMLRFRPILMTTMAALFGALPLAFGTGTGSELRRPLGITIIGGLLFSQALTLYTTPVVYLYMDRLQSWFKTHFKKRSIESKEARVVTSVILLFLLAGCSSVGPTYQKPEMKVPSEYREAAAWKVAQPKDEIVHGKWWEMFHDPVLNRLEEQVDQSNQNIAVAFANFMQARTLVKEAVAQYAPNLKVAPSVSAQKMPYPPTSGIEYSIPLQASWEIDLWGRIRQTLEQNIAGAQASAADLENERLVEEAALAVYYWQLRGQDSLKLLYDQSVGAYQNSLDLTRALLETGIDTDEAVSQAQTQLESTRAQATQLEMARAQYEHAIALLVGESASTFSLSSLPLTAIPPKIPQGVPSQLLECRPDIASAERAMAQANAQIGIAMAAYYPTLTLSGQAGFGSNALSTLFSLPNLFWSVGATLAETLYDGGLRAATVEQYRANYDRTVASYRQTVLTAFQQVEDNLSNIRILEQEVKQENLAVESAKRTLGIATERYKLGLDPYLNVITAQVSLLTNQQVAMNLSITQMTSSVQLLEALGGGWDLSELPSETELRKK